MRRVRSNRAPEGETDPDCARASPRGAGDLPTVPTRQEEASLVAERLAALVEGRRAKPVPTTGPPPGPVVGGVVGVRHSGRLLGNLLVTRGYIVETELNYALARQAGSSDPIGRILVDLGLITDRDLVELLAEQLRMQVVDLSRVDRDPTVLARLTKADARRRVALPLRSVDGLIEVAVAEPTDDSGVAELMALLGAPMRLFLATRADIDAAIDRFYG